MCSEPILECLVEPLHATVSLGMAQSSPDMFDSSALHEGSEVDRDELGPLSVVMVSGTPQRANRDERKSATTLVVTEPAGNTF